MDISASDHDKTYLYKHWCITFLDIDIDVIKLVRMVFANVWFPKYFVAPTYETIRKNLNNTHFIDQGIVFNIFTNRDYFYFGCTDNMWYMCNPFRIQYNLKRDKINISLSENSLFSMIYAKNKSESCWRSNGCAYKPIIFVVYGEL